MIERQVIHLRFGAMPLEVADWLDLVNVQATLGYELLEHYAVSLALGEGILGLEPLSPAIH